MAPAFACLVGGVLPFGAVFIELFFILTSVWLHQFYYLFGFLALVFVILCLTCAEITIVLCYFQLCSEVRVGACACGCAGVLSCGRLGVCVCGVGGVSVGGAPALSPSSSSSSPP